MDHAWPADELDPIKCQPKTRNWKDESQWYLNDVLGNYSLTLVDTLDTLVVMGERDKFESAVRNVISTVSFDSDARVQVFELNIRALGGLLSAHIFASDPQYGFHLPWYRDELLKLATDVGNRILPAFGSSTGIPYARINLLRGLMPHESVETCTAGAGSLILEMGTLSRLTGDPKYENAAKGALQALWKRRSSLDLFGNIMFIHQDYWKEAYAGIGGGSDSFFEYLFKAYILFGEQEFLEAFDVSYLAILKWIRDDTGFFYKNVRMDNGQLLSAWVDSLSAFFPGLQVLAGDVENAVKPHLLYYKIWSRFHALPERYNLQSRDAENVEYPLRPELIESTYLLYQATQNHFYLNAGEQILEDLEKYARVDCGFVSLSDVVDGHHGTRMESFFLSETLKYLFLLFDADHFLNTLDSNFVFTTEGHFLVLPYSKQTKLARKNGIQKSPTCPIPKTDTSISSLIHPRPLLSFYDIGVANWLSGSNEAGDMCLSDLQNQMMRVNVMIPNRMGQMPSKPNIMQFFYGLLVDQLGGSTVTLQLNRQRTAFDIVSLNNEHEIKPGQVIKVPKHGVPSFDSKKPFKKARLTNRCLIGQLKIDNDLDVHEVYPAAFGPRLRLNDFIQGQVVPLMDDPALGLDNVRDGCEASHFDSSVMGKIVLVKRGRCVFTEKATWAQQFGALGVIVLSRSQSPLLMEGSESGLGVYDSIDLIDIPVFFAQWTVSKALLKSLGLVRIDISENLNHVTELALQYSNLPISNMVILNPKCDPKPEKRPKIRYRRQGIRRGLLEFGSYFKCLVYCPLFQNTCCSYRLSP